VVAIEHAGGTAVPGRQARHRRRHRGRRGARRGRLARPGRPRLHTCLARAVGVRRDLLRSRRARGAAVIGGCRTAPSGRRGCGWIRTSRCR